MDDPLLMRGFEGFGNLPGDGQGFVPVSISNNTAPNAQISARLSTGFPRACSGDMYAAVPMITPI